MASDEIEDLMVVADDMGSIALNEEGKLVGYGTEMGAFVRLDDLQSGYALGQIDRTIIMNPDQVNARVVIACDALRVHHGRYTHRLCVICQ